MSEPQQPRVRHELPSIVVIIATALLVQVVPWLGIPLHSDVIPTYRLQVSTLPGLAEAVPYGLRVATAYPMGPWEACVEQYRAYTRFNCVDVLLFRATAWVAGGSAEAWRLIYFGLNAASIGLFFLAARAVGAARLLAAALALGLATGPGEIWNGYHTSEPKATLLLMLALVLALGPSTLGRSALVAGLMLLATLTKETFATVWVAVIAVALARYLERSGQPALRTLRSEWRPLLRQFLLPHAVVLLLVVAFAAGLRLAYEPRANYAYSAVSPYPPLADSLLGYWTALQPPLVRGLLLPTLAAGVAALVVALACSRCSRQGLVRAYARPSPWVLVCGLGLAVALHGLGYYLAKRPVEDSRYLLPANYLFSLAVAGLLAPLAAGLTARMRTLVGLAVGLAAAGALLWRLGRLNELAMIGLGLAALVGLLALLVLLALPGGGVARRLTVAAYAAIFTLLLVPYADVSLYGAGLTRVNLDEIAAFHARVLAEAPPNGHVVLRIAEPYMIEDVWGTEASTLLAGRLDLTYHLEVEDLSRLANDNGLVRSLIDAYNADRRPLPMSGEGVIVIRMNRDGMGRGGLRRVGGEEAVRLLLSSPRAFLANRYLDGRMPGLVYEIARGRPAG